MLRQGWIKRGLAVVLVILTITPQMLLRPCCCSQPAKLAKSVDEALASVAGNDSHKKLSPCCLKRLQASRAAMATVAKSQAGETRQGVHDSERCRCQQEVRMARASRVVVNPSVLRLIAVESLSICVDGTGRDQVVAASWSEESSNGPHWAATPCVRLCRWLV